MREPAAEGFYPFSKTALQKQVSEFLASSEKRKAIGLIAPHAGYAFSGSVAGKTYASVSEFKKTIMLFGPNHTGFGQAISLSTDDWKTPLGIVKTDSRFEKILPVSESAHEYEHSIEVQLPFLQALLKDFKIIPAALSHLPLQQIEELAGKLAGREIFYIASSDFTHFGPNYSYMPVRESDSENLKYIKEMDMKAIDFILKIQPEKFYNFVTENEMTICGFVPITLLLFICRKLGAKRGFLVDYKTSYEVQPSSSFVDYAGILIE
jgi:hypothetical protein